MHARCLSRSQNVTKSKKSHTKDITLNVFQVRKMSHLHNVIIPTSNQD